MAYPSLLNRDLAINTHTDGLQQDLLTNEPFQVLTPKNISQTLSLLSQTSPQGVNDQELMTTPSLWQLDEAHEHLTHQSTSNTDPCISAQEEYSHYIQRTLDAQHLYEAFNHFFIGMMQLDEFWNLTFIHQPWLQKLGFPSSFVAERGWIDLIHTSDRSWFLEKLYADIREEKNANQDIRLVDKYGDIKWFNVHYSVNLNPQNNTQQVSLLLFDIHNKHARHEQALKIAKTDLLTQLGNRYAFQEEFRANIKLMYPGETFYLLLMDLDGFKAINDAYGHSIGDKLLQEAAQRLKLRLQPDDFVSRLGGDEFAIIKRANTKDEARQYCEKLLQDIAQPYKLLNNMEESYISSSIGILPIHLSENLQKSRDNKHELQEIISKLLVQADAAMYQAKFAGKNTYRFYKAPSEDTTRNRVLMNDNLHRAIERQEFDLYYQPQMNCQNGELYGYEALIRWNRNNLVTASPEEFIPLVESNGLMSKVGRWVFQKAISDHAKVLQHYFRSQCSESNPKPPTLSVNFSPIQFREQHLVDFIEQTIVAHQVPPETVTVEVTENLLNSNLIQIGERLQQLKELGLNIALDDFGTGYSSLSILYKHPIDIIKVDKQFITNLHVHDTQKIVLATIKLCAELNKTILLEGVESQQQLQFLQKNGAQLIQGWLMSKAIDFNELQCFIFNRT